MEKFKYYHNIESFCLRLEIHGVGIYRALLLQEYNAGERHNPSNRIVDRRKKMREKNEDRIKMLLNDVDKEFKQLDHLQRAKFAIEQISVWQQKFSEAKVKIPQDNFVDTVAMAEVIGQYPEIEA